MRDKTEENTRTAQQSRKMWAMLRDLAKQLDWPVDGVFQKITDEDWKHIMSAGLKRHQRIADGIDGGFVMLGQSTRRMKISEMSDLIEIMYAFGASRNVLWTNPEDAARESYYQGKFV